MAPQSSLIGAAQWFVGLFVGSLGTSLVILGVAALGFAMLAGQLPLKGGLRVLMGAIMLFSAPSIADGLKRSAIGERVDVAQSPVPLAPTVPQKEPTFDPYAGATTPQAQ